MLATTPYRRGTANYSLKFICDLLGLALSVRVCFRVWFKSLALPLPSNNPDFLFRLPFSYASQVRHFCRWPGITELLSTAIPFSQ